MHTEVIMVPFSSIVCFLHNSYESVSHIVRFLMLTYKCFLVLITEQLTNLSNDLIETHRQNIQLLLLHCCFTSMVNI